MSNTGVLQVRADARLITQAQKKAAALGFSSVQELVRVILKNITTGTLTFAPTVKKEQFPPEHIKLGPKAKKRWANILRDADNNRNMHSFKDSEEALKFLLSEDR